MICDFCLMDRIVVLKLPVTLHVEGAEPKELKWGKNRAICPVCVEAEAMIIEQEQEEKKEQQQPMEKAPGTKSP